MLSIITPVLNGVRFIEKNILSIQKLTIPFEHIIVDGGSTDGTLKIVKKYPHLKLVYQKEKTGMYGAIDMGFSITKGEYICWVNSDDQIISNSFERLYYFAQQRKFDFVCSDGIVKDINTNRRIAIRGTRFVKYFLKQGYFPFLQPSTIYTSELYQRVDGLNFNNYKICGDMDLFYRMSLISTAKFGYIPMESTIFIKHGNSLGDLNTQNSINERIINGNIPKAKAHNRYLLKVVRTLHI